jgi:hypothetical protein
MLAACQPAATPAPTQAPAEKPAEQKPAAAEPTTAPAVPAQPAPPTQALLATAQPKANPPQSGGVLNPPTNVPTPRNNPANVDASARLNWPTYRDDTIGLAFQYPDDWQRQIEQGPQLVRRIIFSPARQPGEKNATLTIDVRKKQGDLLTWLRTQIPTGQLLIGSAGLEGGSTSYQRINASLAGLPAVFLYRPAKSSAPDLAALFTADNQHIYQFTYLGDIPDDLANRAIYLHLLNAVVISGSVSSGVALPSTGFTTGVDLNQIK